MVGVHHFTHMKNCSAVTNDVHWLDARRVCRPQNHTLWKLTLVYVASGMIFGPQILMMRTRFLERHTPGPCIEAFNRGSVSPRNLDVWSLVFVVEQSTY